MSACVSVWMDVCIFSLSELVHFSNTLNRIQNNCIGAYKLQNLKRITHILHTPGIQFLFLTISKFSNVPIYLNLIHHHPLVEIHRKESTRFNLGTLILQGMIKVLQYTGMHVRSFHLSLSQHNILCKQNRMQ